MSSLHSLIIISDSDSPSTLENLLAGCRRPLELSATTITRREGLNRLGSDSPPQVVILVVQSIAQGIRDVSAILAVNPQAMIVATAEEKHPEWVPTLIRAGVDEYVTTPITTDGVEELLERAALMFVQRQGGGGWGKVITVYNPSGGIGATTIAVNLAAALAVGGEIAALVDLNPFSSDVSAFLDLNPAYTLSTLRSTERRMNAGRLMDAMTRHASGVQVLCGPEETGAIVEITQEQMRDLLTTMRSRFGVTVIDAGGALSERNLETFDGSDVIIYPLLLTLPVLRNARRYLRGLHRQGFGPDKVKVVVNRHLPEEEMPIAQAEEFLGAPLLQTIPNSYPEVKESIYRGSPIVIGYPRSPVARALVLLAERIMTELNS